jgi:hypothetical protein
VEGEAAAERHVPAAASAESAGGCAIPLGVYGWMVHTRFFATRGEGDAAFAAMRPELAAIPEAMRLEDGPEADRKSRRVPEMIGASVDRRP